MLPPTARANGPLVGRQREIAAFDAALLRVAAGFPCVLQVTGEVGAGRSRLLGHFAKMAALQHARVVSMAGDDGDERPFGALLRAAIGQPLNALSRAAQREPAASDPTGALLGIIESLCRSQPLWLVFDDLHYCDVASTALVERLIGTLHNGALARHRLGLAFSLVEAGEPLAQKFGALDAGGQILRLPLAGLDEEAVSEWLAARFGVPPDPGLVSWLSSGSAGNPLLLEGLVGALQRAGLLTVRGGRLLLANPAASTTLPADTGAVLQERLAALSRPCRLAMTLAACLGMEFRANHLAGLLRMTASQVRTLLDEGAAASVVMASGAGSYRFRHVGTRDLIYAEPDDGFRADTHNRIARALLQEVGAAADQHCLTIARHLMRAEGRADPAITLRFTRQAGALADQHHSYLLAGRYFEAAARAGRDLLSPEDLADLHQQAGDAFQNWSDGARSNEHFQTAAELYKQSGDDAGQAHALHGLLRNLVAYGEGEDGAAEVAERLERLVDSLPRTDADLRVRAHDALASFHFAMARYAAAEDQARTALGIAMEAADPGLRCIPASSLALAQLEQFRLSEARATWLEGLSHARAAGNRRYEGFHLQRLPIPMFCVGDVAEAARYNQASYQHNRAIGNTGELSLNLSVDVMVANLRGDFDAAIGAGRDGLALAASSRYPWGLPPLIAALAYALIMREDFESARQVIAHLSSDNPTVHDARSFHHGLARLERLLAVHQRPFAAAGDVAPRPLRQTSQVRLGSVALLCSEVELGLLDRAPVRLEGVQDTLEFVHRRGLALSPGWCCTTPRSLGIAAGLRGNRSRADEYFQAAQRLAERCGAPLESARVHLQRGIVLLAGAAPDRDTARDELSRALDELADFAAPALVRLAEAALARCDRRPQS